MLSSRPRVSRPRSGTPIQPRDSRLQLPLCRPQALRERHPLCPGHVAAQSTRRTSARLLGLARQPGNGSAPGGCGRAGRRHEAPVPAWLVGAGAAVSRVGALVGAAEEGATALELGAATWATVGGRAHAGRTRGAAVVTWTRVTGETRWRDRRNDRRSLTGVTSVVTPRHPDSGCCPKGDAQHAVPSRFPRNSGAPRSFARGVLRGAGRVRPLQLWDSPDFGRRTDMRIRISGASGSSRRGACPVQTPTLRIRRVPVHHFRGAARCSLRSIATPHF